MSYIKDAQRMVEKLANWESRGPGDIKLALGRVARKYNLPRSTLWSIKYRPPKGIFWDVYERLRRAYETECRRQAEILRQEIKTTQDRIVSPGLAQSVLSSAEALVRAIDQ